MKTKEEIIKSLQHQGLLPLYFHQKKSVAESILRALYGAGIRIVEFTHRGPEAPEVFRELIRIRTNEMPDLLLAVGTIKTAADCQLYLNAGADFIISPGLSEAVAATAEKANACWVPGCMTPSEIITAESLGAKLIKLFPGDLLGPRFLRSIRELFPALSFLPTGGVVMEKQSLTDWFDSGVIAVGAGSTLISKKRLADNDFEGIRNDTIHALELVRTSRSDFRVS